MDGSCSPADGCSEATAGADDLTSAGGGSHGAIGVDRACFTATRIDAADAVTACRAISRHHARRTVFAVSDGSRAGIARITSVAARAAPAAAAAQTATARDGSGARHTRVTPSSAPSSGGRSVATRLTECHAGMTAEARGARLSRACFIQRAAKRRCTRDARGTRDARHAARAATS